MRKNSKYSSRILPEKLDFDFYSYLLGRWLGDGIIRFPLTARLIGNILKKHEKKL